MGQQHAAQARCSISSNHDRCRRLGFLSGEREDVEADGVEVVPGAGEHGDDAGVVERDVEGRPGAAAEGPVGGAVGDELERGDGVGRVADGADRPGHLRHVLRRVQGDALVALALAFGAAAPGPGGVQVAVGVPVGEGDPVDDLAPPEGDALQPPRRRRDVAGAPAVAAPRPDLHRRRALRANGSVNLSAETNTTRCESNVVEESRTEQRKRNEAHHVVRVGDSQCRPRNELSRELCKEKNAMQII